MMAACSGGGNLGSEGGRVGGEKGRLIPSQPTQPGGQINAGEG